MSAAVARPTRRIGLPGSPGVPGPYIEDATDKQLAACLAADRRWLYGGTRYDDFDQPVPVTGFLADVSRNPHGHQTAEAYLADTRNWNDNRRAVQRVVDRIAAIEAEQAERSERARREEERERDDARARLEAFLREDVPEFDEAYQHRARGVLEAWDQVRPLAAALELLDGSFESQALTLPNVHRDLREQADKAAAALGEEPPAVRALPAGLPTYEEVRHAIAVVSGGVRARRRPPLPGPTRSVEHALNKVK